MVKDQRRQIYPKLEQEIDNDIDIKILRVAPTGPGMPFLDNDTCAERGVIYFYKGFFSQYDAIHG
jgi:hypothetical protein